MIDTVALLSSIQTSFDRRAKDLRLGRNLRENPAACLHKSPVAVVEAEGNQKHIGHL